MAQQYVIVAKKNPNEPESDPRYYAQARSVKKVSVKDICARIAERSSYSKGELEGCINEFLLEAAHVLEEGNIAQMGDLGNFRLSVRTKVGAPSIEKFTKANIGEAKVNFWPGATLRKLCRTVDYELYKPEVVEKAAGKTVEE